MIEKDCFKTEMGVYVQQQVRTKEEREEQLVPLEKRTANVTVQVVSEVIDQVS